MVGRLAGRSRRSVCIWLAAGGTATVFPSPVFLQDRSFSYIYYLYLAMSDEEDAFAAFGSDSEQSDDDGENIDVAGASSGSSDSIQLERAADAAVLHITTTFLSQRKSTHLSNRYVALSPSSVGSATFMQRLTSRGVKIVSPDVTSDDAIADAGVLFYDSRCAGEDSDTVRKENERKIRRDLVKGGFLLICLLSSGEQSRRNDTSEVLNLSLIHI